MDRDPEETHVLLISRSRGNPLFATAGLLLSFVRGYEIEKRGVWLMAYRDGG